MYSIQEATIVEYIARSMPIINATLENRQPAHQTSMVEIEGMLKDKPISILIDTSASLSYISPIIVEQYKLQQDQFEKILVSSTCYRHKEKSN